MKIIMQILEFIFNMVVSILKFIFDLIGDLISQVPSRNREYNAEFASQGSLLSSNNFGFCLTGRRNLTLKHSYQNALIIGGTGTGKSSVVLIPSLFTMKGSFIVHDPSGELFTKTSGFLTQKGIKTKVLNFAKPDISFGYNPLVRANTSSEIRKISSMLIDTAFGKAKDPFWNIQGTSLLSMLISILKKQGEEFQNLYNVRLLLNALGGNPQMVDKLFSKHADDVLFAEYKSFLSYDDKVVSGIIATCKASLNLFSDESVAQVTSFDDLDFQEFRDKPTALFIQNSVADQKYYSVLTSLFFEQFFAYIISRFPTEKERDIFLLIDEASSLNLPTLPLAVANVRKHRSGIMLLVQDFSQLIHHYGKYDADGIKSNCFAKMFFTGQSLETSKELEQTLGRYQYEDDKGAKIIRPLMTNDEIRKMEIDRALLISGNNPPIMARLRPYYRSGTFSSYSKIKPPEISREVSFENIPSLLSTKHLSSHE